MDGRATTRHRVFAAIIAAICCAASAAAQSPVGPTTAESRPLGAPSSVESMPIGGGSEGNTGTLGGWLRAGASLALVVGLIGGLAVATRRVSTRAGLAGALGAGGRAPSGVLEVLGRYPVARGQTLVLLKLDRRVLLLSQQAGAGFRTLTEITEPEEVAELLVRTSREEERSAAEKFRGLLQRFDHEHGSRDVSPSNRSTASGGASSRRVELGPDGDRVELLQASGAAGPPSGLAGLLDRLRSTDIRGEGR